MCVGVGCQNLSFLCFCLFLTCFSVFNLVKCSKTLKWVGKCKMGRSWGRRRGEPPLQVKTRVWRPQALSNADVRPLRRPQKSKSKFRKFLRRCRKATTLSVRMYWKNRFPVRMHRKIMFPVIFSSPFQNFHAWRTPIKIIVPFSGVAFGQKSDFFRSCMQAAKSFFRSCFRGFCESFS